MKSAFTKQNFPILLFAGILLVVFFVVFVNEQNKKDREAERNRQALAETSNDQNLQKFNLTGYDDKGKQFWNLEGDAAKIEPGQTVFLDKNVTLKLKDDTIVRTDHMQWDQSSGILNTKAQVFVDHQSTNVKGMGAYGRLNDGFIQLNRQIEMIINVTTRLTCDGPMKVYYNENKMIFYRNVMVSDAKGTLFAKRMDVFFNEEQKKIEKIVAMGDVVMLRGKDKTRSHKAIYTVATGAIRLEGSPEVTIHKEGTELIGGKGIKL